MALEDMQSQYGPINKKGKIGTGVDKDTFAFEGEVNQGLGQAPSKYGLTPLGKPQEKFGGTGERSMGKTPGERMLEI
jgi:hypothetical protein|tara:strand:+ start:294 stop:524 length:231 start_codon:yes stop_codon:yes gene_type:complete